jgi:galactose mutarotase-like enzyme
MRTDTYKVRPSTEFVIAPLFGCNLVSWTIDDRPVFYCPEDFERRPEKFFSGGNPVLFPAVGRTWDMSGEEPIFGEYRIYGDPNVYRMPIHGILPDGHFQKRRERVAGERVEVEYLFTLRQTIQDADYPFDVRLTLRYILKAGTIRMEADMENRGSTPAPVAFGYHPYFYLEDRQGVHVHLPCSEQLTLDREHSIPIGREPSSSNVITLDDSTMYDNVFAGMTGRRASIVDPKAGRTIHIDFDENIENLVIYSRPGEKFVCLEPWTKGLGAFGSLYKPNWQESGDINILQPGEIRTTQVSYTVEG